MKMSNRPRSKAITNSVRIAAKAAQAVGGRLGRSSGIVKLLDPAYRRFLDWSKGGEGVPRLLNGEQFIFDLRYFRGESSYEVGVAQFLSKHIKRGDVILD